LDDNDDDENRFALNLLEYGVLVIFLSLPDFLDAPNLPDKGFGGLSFSFDDFRMAEPNLPDDVFLVLVVSIWV
jgi:hypothetical protein